MSPRHGGGHQLAGVAAPQAAGSMACDCFAVDTVWRRWWSVLLVIGLETRQLHLAG